MSGTGPGPIDVSPERGLLQRAQGCLLGQLAGDALGSMVEFAPAAEIVRRYPAGLRELGPSPVWHTLAGQPTDDSELALALARTLCRTGFVEEAVAEAYGDWLASAPFDVGGTIRQATRAIVDARAGGGSLAGAARAAASRESEANGALMRQSPLAIWGHALDPGSLDQHVRADTGLTHPNEVCQDASSAFVATLAAVIRAGLDGRGAYEHAREWNGRHGRSGAIAEVLAAARHAPPHYEESPGHVVIALQNAFYQALHAATLEEGVVATVMGGGDTDTNAAIAGALLGAIHGVDAVPDRWRRVVLACRPEAGRPGVQRPRPPAYWPVDALVIAEELVATGIHHARGRSAMRFEGVNDTTITAANIDRVLAFRPLFEAPNQPLYEVKMELSPLAPYFYSAEVDRFRSVLAEEGFVVVFDWPAWQAEARRFIDDPDLLASADIPTLQKLFTTHVRAERFASGHLAQAIDRGHIRAMLRRLQAIRDSLVPRGGDGERDA